MENFFTILHPHPQTRARACTNTCSPGSVHTHSRRGTDMGKHIHAHAPPQASGLREAAQAWLPLEELAQAMVCPRMSQGSHRPARPRPRPRPRLGRREATEQRMARADQAFPSVWRGEGAGRGRMCVDREWGKQEPRCLVSQPCAGPHDKLTYGRWWHSSALRMVA